MKNGVAWGRSRRIEAWSGVIIGSIAKFTLVLVSAIRDDKSLQRSGLISVNTERYLVFCFDDNVHRDLLFGFGDNVHRDRASVDMILCGYWSRVRGECRVMSRSDDNCGYMTA